METSLRKNILRNLKDVSCGKSNLYRVDTNLRNHYGIMFYNKEEFNSYFETGHNLVPVTIEDVKNLLNDSKITITNRETTLEIVSQWEALKA